MKRVALIACSASKLDRPAPAAELYRGSLFRKSLTYARAICADVRILSAKHHVVKEDQVLEPYDETLKGMRQADQKRWAAICWAQLDNEFRSDPDPEVHFIFLCGMAYRDRVINGMLRDNLLRSRMTPRGREYTRQEPLEGLGIGQQLAWLDARLNTLQEAS